MVKVKALMDNVGKEGVKAGDTIEVSDKQLDFLIKEKIVEALPKEAPKKEAPKEAPKKATKKNEKEEGEK